MRRMLLAELAILAELDPIRIVFLVLVGPVIAVLADRTGQRNRVAVRTLGHRNALLPEELRNCASVPYTKIKRAQNVADII